MDMWDVEGEDEDEIKQAKIRSKPFTSLSHPNTGTHTTPQNTASPPQKR